MPEQCEQGFTKLPGSPRVLSSAMVGRQCHPTPIMTRAKCSTAHLALAAIARRMVVYVHEAQKQRVTITMGVYIDSLLGISTEIPKLDQNNISSATNENYFFSLILLKYIHMTIC